MSRTELKIERVAEETLLLTIGGDWLLDAAIPSPESVLFELTPEKKIARVAFATARLERWGSGLLVFLGKVVATCRSNAIEVDDSALLPGVRKLLALASPENQRSGIGHAAPPPSLLERVANVALGQVEGARRLLFFLGEVTVAFGRMLRGRGEFRRLDLLIATRETGAQALGIVTLISALVGMILAFVAAIQLKLFGAQIYVADVVGIGVVRVMGAVMTGVIMSGRTGAAFAAQLGTMQVNEEIDALESLGLSSVGFLVLPRVLALALMMPFLCIYSDVMGVIGGMIVGVGMLDLGVMEYVSESQRALNLTHFLVGLFHSFVFGLIVAIAGCLRGIQCERSASAVGHAATSAVVTSIVAIVVATAIITLSCQVLGL